MKKIIGKYREFAKNINSKIAVIKGVEWCCYQDTNEIEIPRLTNEIGLHNFLKSVKKQLQKMGKIELFDKYDDFIWCFLHEMGHLCKPKKYNDRIIRNIIDTMSLWGMEKIANFFYINLKEEKTATEWACKFVVNNPKLVNKYNRELVRTYKRYYKSVGLKTY